MAYRPKLNIDTRLVDLMAKNPLAEAGRSIGAGLIALGERKNIRAKEAKLEKEKQEQIKAQGALNALTNPELAQEFAKTGANLGLINLPSKQGKKLHTTGVNADGSAVGVFSDGSIANLGYTPQDKQKQQFENNLALQTHSQNFKQNESTKERNFKQNESAKGRSFKQDQSERERSFKTKQNLINLGFKESENQKDRIHKKQERQKDRTLRLEQKAQDIRSREQEKQKDRALRKALAPKKNSIIDFDAATPAQKAWAVNNNRWSRDKNGKRIINLDGFSSKQNSANFGDLEL